MRLFVRPKVVISKCIEFDNCRYDGSLIPSDFVKALKPHVDFSPVCAEMEIGLVPFHRKFTRFSMGFTILSP